MIILGPMNEPSFPENALDWPPIQTHLIETIRANAPKNTIVATGLGGNLNDLLNLIPLADSNIVYDFHFYEPYPFTHQGANWSDPRFTPLRNVPYPSNPQAVATLLPQLGFPDSQKLLEDYGTSNWNAEAVTARIASDADWATLFKVPLICAEFGVLRDYAPPAGRAQWIKDVRTAFEANGIGWAMWEYDSNFGLATRDGQNVTIDADIARALGLDPSRWKTGN
jgi:hypothetical protein